MELYKEHLGSALRISALPGQDYPYAIHNRCMAKLFLISLAIKVLQLLQMPAYTAQSCIFGKYYHFPL